MNTYNQPVYSFTQEALHLVGEARLAYVRKVYSYFGLGVVAAVVGSVLGMNSPLAFAIARAPFIGIIMFLGLVWFASRSATNPARAVPSLMLATFFSGLFISPTLYAIAHGYIRGTSVNTIYSALTISTTAFAGLTAYVFVTKKDFTYMGATLMIGLFMVIGLSVVNFFIASSTLDLALAGVTAILFSGFILVDTSRILKNAHAVPPTLAALTLFLDFLNLFMAVLRLLSGGRDRR